MVQAEDRWVDQHANTLQCLSKHNTNSMLADGEAHAPELGLKVMCRDSEQPGDRVGGWRQYG